MDGVAQITAFSLSAEPQELAPPQYILWNLLKADVDGSNYLTKDVVPYEFQ